MLKHEHSCFQGKQTDLFVFPCTAPQAALFNFSEAPHLLIAGRTLAPTTVIMGKINQIMSLYFYLHANLYINLWGWGFTSAKLWCVGALPNDKRAKGIERKILAIFFYFWRNYYVHFRRAGKHNSLLKPPNYGVRAFLGSHNSVTL